MKADKLGSGQEPYDIQTAKADQEKIMTMFENLREELRKTGASSTFASSKYDGSSMTWAAAALTGLENLFVDKKIKTANGKQKSRHRVSL